MEKEKDVFYRVVAVMKDGGVMQTADPLTGCQAAETAQKWINDNIFRQAQMISINRIEKEYPEDVEQTGM